MLHIVGLVMGASLLVGQAGEAKVPSEFLKVEEYFIGDWVMEGHQGNKTFKAKYSFAWAPGKHCVLFHASWSGPDSTSQGTGIEGWDSSRRQFLLSEFWSDGSSNVFRFSMTSPKVWEGEGVGADSAGRPVRGKARGVMETPDEWSWTGTRILVGDEPQPDVKLTFRRVKAKK